MSYPQPPRAPVGFPSQKKKSVLPPRTKDDPYTIDISASVVGDAYPAVFITQMPDKSDKDNFSATSGAFMRRYWISESMTQLIDPMSVSILNAVNDFKCFRVLKQGVEVKGDCDLNKMDKVIFPMGEKIDDRGRLQCCFVVYRITRDMS